MTDAEADAKAEATRRRVRLKSAELRRDIIVDRIKRGLWTWEEGMRLWHLRVDRE